MEDIERLNAEISSIKESIKVLSDKALITMRQSINTDLEMLSQRIRALEERMSNSNQ